MEAVIVATARSPIGRANKGSLVDLRPDDLGATIVQAAARAKVPALDPAEVEDVIWGCAQPAGEAGQQRRPRHRAARRTRAGARRHREPLLLVVAPDHPHGRARDQGRRGRRVRRRRRRDGEPLPQRHGRRRAGNAQRAVRRCRGAHRSQRSQGGSDRGRPLDGLPDVYIAMGQTAENVAEYAKVTREEMDEFAALLATACGRVTGERVLRA